MSVNREGEDRPPGDRAPVRPLKEVIVQLDRLSLNSAPVNRSSQSRPLSRGSSLFLRQAGRTVELRVADVANLQLSPSSTGSHYIYRLQTRNGSAYNDGAWITHEGLLAESSNDAAPELPPQRPGVPGSRRESVYPAQVTDRQSSISSASGSRSPQWSWDSATQQRYYRRQDGSVIPASGAASPTPSESISRRQSVSSTGTATSTAISLGDPLGPSTTRDSSSTAPTQYSMRTSSLANASRSHSASTADNTPGQVQMQQYVMGLVRSGMSLDQARDRARQQAAVYYQQMKASQARQEGDDDTSEDRDEDDDDDDGDRRRRERRK